jgi:16S rRNA (adenine1518-N6/adenine1519-N6)-dimethyltransferase
MFLTPQQYLRQHQARPRKRFGQHFLAQPATAERIVESATLEPSDLVVEIGPGLGALTRFILSRTRRLHLVELDRDLAQYLDSSIPPSECQVVLHSQDVMDFDFAGLAANEASSLVLLGNLPYNISSPLLFHLLESAEVLNRAVFMLQKEVGDRLAARPGGKDYGVLSALLGMYARVTPLFSVGPGQFHPPPRVDSLVIRIDFHTTPIAHRPPFSALRRVVNTAFQQRRKTLLNSLKGLKLSSATLLEAFSNVGIDPNRRPETLHPHEFVNLTNALCARCRADLGKGST